MRIYIIAALGITVTLGVLLLLAACQQTPVDMQQSSERTACRVDVECVCGGIDRLTGKCFVGNREYYDQFVDKSMECPDFCTGLAENMETKCVEERCQQVVRAEPATECQTDSDCMTGGCSGQVCGVKEQVNNVLTTCEWRPEYGCLKTHASCGCNDGKCGWSEQQGYDACVAAARANPDYNVPIA